jgi:hypothetical protein
MEETNLESKSTNLKVGPNLIRVILYNGSIPTMNEEIIKKIKDKDKESNLKFYESTGKIVGTVSEYKIPLIKNLIETMDSNNIIKRKNISSALKSNDSKKKVLVEEKTENDSLEDNIIDLIKYIYKKTDSKPLFLKENGISYEKLINLFLYKGILIKINGEYVVSKDLGTAKQALKMIMDIVSILIKQNTKNKFKIIANNGEIVILKNSDGLFVLNSGDDNEKIEKEINNSIKTLSKGEGVEDFDNGIDLVKIDDELKKHLLDLYDKNKDIVNALSNINEITGASSSGSFTAPMSGNVIKKNDLEVPVVSETTTQTAGKYTYDANPLPDITRDGSFKKHKKTKAEKQTQYKDGEFVDLNDCTKLNNKPAGSGCSQGAIDNVVTTKKSKFNVISPSLNESLKLQFNKKDDKLIVISDLQGKAASQETFSNKNVLKQNGFQWNGSNWVIPYDKLDIAKSTLSIINKAEYIIDTLEEVGDAVNDSAIDTKSAIKAKLEQYISDLANATDEKALSAEIRRYLTFFSKFHSYSYTNRILIYLQRPNATNVASYKKWQEKFRQVKKGSKAIWIFAPIIVKDKTDNSDEDLEIKNKIVNFRAVTVFDILDTEPIDERGEIPEVPTWWGDNTPSETSDKLYNALVEVSKNMGINVTNSDSKDGEHGWSSGDHINLSANINGVGKLSTMIHELAHELMHHKKTSIYYQGDDTKLNHALVELQAESVSYVVLKHYELPTESHATYLALYRTSKENIQNNLEIISKVSQFIIDRIDEEIRNTNN